MANKYNWKDNYGFDESVYIVDWLSILGSKNIRTNLSTRNNPSFSRGVTSITNSVADTSTLYVILSSGIHTGSINYSVSSMSKPIVFIGDGMGNSISSKETNSIAYNQKIAFHNMSVNKAIYNNSSYFTLYYKCDIKFDAYDAYAAFVNCKLRTWGKVDNNSNSALSFINVLVTNLNNPQVNNILWDHCYISISSQAEVNLSASRYAAFNNCKFKIGLEPDYTSLSGSTAEELRASFVVRCKAAGLNVPAITEYGETLQAGRWVFSKGSAADGLVITGSEIHQFEIPRLISFGYKPERGDLISVTSDRNRANSFSPEYADNNALAVTNEGIFFKPSIDVSKRINASAKSNIIWLGEKSQVNLINIIHNFPKEYGIFVDSTPTLSDSVVTTIKEGKTYYVRSSNTDEATIVYNNVTYSSALLNQANIFFGVPGETSFTNFSGNAVVYEVIDNKAIHQTIQMRIVNKIPAGKILAGTSLASGYWYLVEHDLGQSNKTDYVTYNGVNYPVGGSFLASGTASFTKSGNVHLRRCWRDTFDYGSETVDKSFWENEQKPIWFDVRPDDLRCLMKNNNANASEMLTDAVGGYRASGHESFYNDILGASGVRIPAFPIKGTYMQLRLVITTQNPM